ncbi:methyltransferase domain-containing protein [Mycobacterium helveticum]|uniref:Methyltransferase domain-containing protein n=1 Tax=Mycobacterium helveticum TaxID=2592811 RepID=A0A557XEC6_9MYCO|nr:methyltransferase domain-containing protein [Mycobacterium helveticum]TVS83931.1 methyltransferase domain-containing protein [Mycobacterium helveticum]TVS84398.1 methyltransferase domain-containing protein [Mycobacterium helveticum]
MDLAVRSTAPEVLEDESVALADYRRCLADLAVVNRMTLTHRPALRWLARATRTLPAGAEISVLDVGYGDGDLLRAIARWADRRGLKARLSGIDLNPRSAAAAHDATPPELAIDYRIGDVFAHTPDEPPQFIVSSQFTHHLSDREVVEFLMWLQANSVRGWHIADLHRSSLAYHFFTVLARVMRWHPIVRSDGRISIARSFRRADWQKYLDQAGVRAEISWYACRLCVWTIT